MNKRLDEQFEKVLAVYPKAKGYAYVLMEGPTQVLEQKMVSISPVDNTKILKEITDLLKTHTPQALILEDTNGKFSRKGGRGKQLIRSLCLSAKYLGISVYSYAREDIRFVFEIWRAKTKYEIAEVIAKNIKGFEMLLYPKPKYPGSQKYLTALFDAVSLGITHYYKTT
ncbi:hypothetical protein [Aequorivita sediminis]|uniref:hypothetical protein n=1 Tax=Aequorivita sediminis TaxID=3073653 RepID=UPI0028A7F368|nr:hypothetical protein [Aequorivita sp. F6058]